MIPEGYDLPTWFNQIVSNLSQANMRLDFYTKDAPIFSTSAKADVQTAVNDKTISIIEESIKQLQELEKDIIELKK